MGVIQNTWFASVFASIVAAAVGLHVAALHIEHQAHKSELAVVLTTAVPVAYMSGVCMGGTP